jgi:hypothetical protein
MQYGLTHGQVNAFGRANLDSKPMNRILNGAAILIALPVYQLYWFGRYVTVQKTAARKIGTAFAMAPIFVLSTLVWAGAWMLCYGAFSLIVR